MGITSNPVKAIVFDFDGTLMDSVTGLLGEAFVPGAKEFVEQYSGQILFFISSAASQQKLESILEREKWSKHFKKVYGSSTPKTQALIEILEDYDLHKNELLFVGDGFRDNSVAIEVGCPFVGVAREGQQFPQAIAHIQNLLELRDILQLK
ncbi:MAG: HAD family hydrolase [Bdellovibrionales bacterium]